MRSLLSLARYHTLANLMLVALLLFSAYAAYLIYQQERQAQQLKEDLAEISHIRYGLLSLDEWEQKLSRILEQKISEYELSGGNREELEHQARELIVRMIDATAASIQSQYQQQGGVMGWMKQAGFGMMVDLEALKEDAPNIAQSFVSVLDEPQSRDRLKLFVAEQIRHYAAQTLTETDLTHYHKVLARYHALDGKDAMIHIRQQLDTLQFAVNQLAWLLLITALPLVLAAFSSSIKAEFSLSLLLLLALALLYPGIASPMIDIDARIGQLTFFLAGERLVFTDQVLFFQSKSIMDLVRILLGSGDYKLALVGLLVLLFSVLFPLTKILCSASWLTRPKLRQRNHPLLHFFVFRSGKWSMADVMVVAILMAYLGFTGIMDSQLQQLDSAQGAIQVLTTNSSELQSGFYFFTAFCLLGLLISQLASGRLKPGTQA